MGYVTDYDYEMGEKLLTDCREDLRAMADRWDTAAGRLPGDSASGSALRGCAAELRAYERTWEIEE